MLSDALAILVCGWLPPALYPALGRMRWDVNSIRTSRSIAKGCSSREHAKSTTQATKPPPRLASRPLFPSDLKEPSWDVTFLRCCKSTKVGRLEPRASGLLSTVEVSANCCISLPVMIGPFLGLPWSASHVSCMQEDVSSAQQGHCPEDVLSWEKTQVLGSICLQLAVNYPGKEHGASCD